MARLRPQLRKFIDEQRNQTIASQFFGTGGEIGALQTVHHRSGVLTQQLSAEVEPLQPCGHFCFGA